ERALVHLDHAAKLLLLAQADLVSRGFTPLRLGHARDAGLLLEDALRVALIALEEQLLLFAAAQLADGVGIAGHRLHPPGFRRTAAVVRNRRDVLEADDEEAGGAQRAHGGLAARSRALDENGDLLDSELDGLLGHLAGRHAGGEGRALLRAAEAGAAG